MDRDVTHPAGPICHPSIRLHNWLTYGSLPKNHKVRNIAITAAAIAAVDNQPIAQSGQGRMNRPMTFLRTAINMITAINGGAATPLMTPDQSGGGDRAVEGFRIEGASSQPGRPIQCLAEGVGSRAGEHRHGQHADA